MQYILIVVVLKFEKKRYLFSWETWTTIKRWEKNLEHVYITWEENYKYVFKYVCVNYSVKIIPDKIWQGKL